ncbi:MAG: DUF4493 domain-containing protein [Rikenellaceae bacterium]
MYKSTKYLLLCLLLICGGCTSNNNISEDIILSEGYGALTFSVEANLNYTTKADDDLELIVPSKNDFTVSITPTDTSSEQEPFESAYSDLPVAVEMMEGEYSVKALAGQDEDFSTTTPTYLAQSTEIVEAGRITNVSLTATMRSYAVQINYRDDFLEAFDTFWVEAIVGDGRYEFAGGASEIAYITPGESRYILKGTTSSGQDYSSIFAELDSEGREHYILNLSIRPQGQGFTLDVDTEVIDLDFTTDIDPSLYPDMPTPEFGALEFYETEDYSSETSNNSVVKFVALTTLEDAEIEFYDSKFADFELDILKTYTLSNSEDVAELSAAGVTIVEGALGERSISLSLGALASQMECESLDGTTYNFRARSKDVLSEEDGTSLSSEAISTMTILPIDFTLPEVSAANIWSKEFTINTIAQSNITNGNLEVVNSRGGFTYEWSSDGENWSDIDPATLCVSGLTGSTSLTTYYARANYRFYTSNIVSLTTEAQTQIPNNDFSTNYYTENNGQPCYWFFASGASATDQWWATRNAKTTSEGINAKYTRYSGSRTTSGSGVELVTCGWGSGNTAAGSISVVNNVWAGAIFLGTYSADSYDNSANENHGKEFASRPTALTFSFKYSPYNNSDNYIAKIWLENRTGSTTTTLASGSATSTSTVSSWTSKTITLTYTNTSLPITHLCVAFYSGKNENSSSYISKPSFASSNPALGSVFYVNNVTLVYGK